MAPFNPETVVPALRSDLIIAEPEGGAGTRSVDIQDGDRLTTLLGFEVQLARMLDGHRTARDVVTRAWRLGIPLQLPALAGFIRHLDDDHLLARNLTESSPWRARHRWTQAERDLYAVALRRAREGAVDEARHSIDRLIELSPFNPEALQLRSELDGHALRSFREIYRESEHAWLADSRPSRSELRAVRPAIIPWVFLALLLLSIAVAFFVPFPRLVSAPATLAPQTITDVMLYRATTVDSVHVSEGQRVREGSILAVVDGQQVITAPASGTVRRLAVADSDAVEPGDLLMQIADESRLRMTAVVPTNEARAVKAGERVTLSLAGVGGRRATGVVTAVSGQTVVGELDNADGRIEPGHAYADIDVPPASLMQRLK